MALILVEPARAVNTVYYQIYPTLLCLTSLTLSAAEILIMTTKQLHLRLGSDEMENLQKLAKAYGVNSTALAIIFVSAAMKAIERNKNRLSLPLEFSLAESCQAPASKK
jgi:hypothetical protein